MRKTRKKYAFISYNHHDVLWAIRLKAKMIWFKLPTYIENEFKNSKYLEPVFRDRDYFTSGNLQESNEYALRPIVKLNMKLIGVNETTGKYEVK